MERMFLELHAQCLQRWTLSTASHAKWASCQFLGDSQRHEEICQSHPVCRGRKQDSNPPCPSPASWAPLSSPPQPLSFLLFALKTARVPPSEPSPSPPFRHLSAAAPLAGRAAIPV